MTLDFIETKGGNPKAIRESQQKHDAALVPLGHSVELVDEGIQMYADWVKIAYFSVLVSSILAYSTIVKQ
ncbi:Serine-tRNA ligase [Mycena sanguinolenta]|uniref:Serine-tRNA ligase n=1 Tax=Mycena sanguinolenta TaxID=230812 RepID=A0A8H6YYK6_9AGAR|nr:Serine-tRNA ligase [Mycena sanguinolenta]